eukprot:gnl/TRDRNA2_/TRDRNA2_36149_c0_seq1.p1 gnl/TRDRNA2_/TRDRNA2_36149_c0~~gnl/TRDRNA2_/TRDRNA2_36149_c0_seq1.p1  ORF type:complete len:330 (-),score=33.03 gnl/TRDRNA2_/TRDRNA2_36149_c0_seq1:52-1041(-)
MAAFLGDRDGGGNGYGPSGLWWVFNFSYFALAYVVYLCFFSLEHVSRLVVAEADMSAYLPWALGVLSRNLLITGVWCYAWHYFMYVKRAVPTETKFNPSFEVGYLYERDRLYTFVGATIVSIYEIFVTLLWASGVVPYAEHEETWRRPAWTFFWIVFSFWWSDVHFWFAHRSMHAWFTKNWRTVDPGAFLYRYVHSLHHKSHNPGPWSGLAMHPVEHLIYFTRGMFTLLYASHPSVFLFVQLRSMIGPAVGHHGFSGYGGSLFHHIHHAKFECNFGTSRVVPIDHIMGTYRADLKAKRDEPADPSLRALVWVLGLPYLLPLGAAAYLLR